MTPYVYTTTDLRQDVDALVAAGRSGVRGYAHVDQGRLGQAATCSSLGTEFGLWVSIDGGTHWAQFKGGDLPDVAVRDLAIQPRDNDLVIATHGRGIWIVDDITPLRALDAEDARQRSRVPADAPDPAAHQRVRRLGRRRRQRSSARIRRAAP